MELVQEDKQQNGLLRKKVFSNFLKIVEIPNFESILNNTLQKKNFLFVSMITLQKWWKMLFNSSLKLFSFSRYLNFCLDFLGM